MTSFRSGSSNAQSLQSPIGAADAPDEEPPIGAADAPDEEPPIAAAGAPDEELQGRAAQAAGDAKGAPLRFVPAKPIYIYIKEASFLQI